ncbi:hypothetical protein [Aquiflexum sp.]|uniref:hypothetical protein n=1 Tax=Aquiflexum sp. TaxID=1872584 RepID=UPI0035932126
MSEPWVKASAPRFLLMSTAEDPVCVLTLEKSTPKPRSISDRVFFGKGSPLPFEAKSWAFVSAETGGVLLFPCFAIRFGSSPSSSPSA